jgi:phage protein D/phage baseplate assembly protein gpV
MPAAEPRIGQFFIQINGADLAPDVISALDDAVVEDDLAQPAMFSLRFNDPQFKLIDGDLFRLGSEVKLSAADPQGKPKPLLVGEVTALEPQIEQHNIVLVVRGYDRAHRLHRGSKTRTFLKQSDSDLASQIAREVGLRADVEATGIQYDYIIQDNQTDMEFLRARAARIGYQIVVDDRTLKFRRAEGSPPKAQAQDFGPTLLSFRARVTAAAQPNEVQVRGWDPKAKRAVVGKAASPAQPTKIGLDKNGGELAKTAFGAPATVTITDQPVRDQAEADKLAQAILDELAGDYLAAEGVCRGEPSVKAGALVEIKNVGSRLSGTYFVTASRHEYTAKGGYMTNFYVDGRRAHSLLAAIDGAKPRPGSGGVVIGIVTNIKDPDGLSRVKVKFPWLDNDQESDWARLATPGAGKDRGFFSMPEVEDEVLVAFEQGDRNKPYVLGGLWNGKDKPPATAEKGGKVQVRAFKSRAGHVITLNDEDGAGKQLIEIKTAGGHTITLGDGDKLIKIKSQSHSITLDDQGRAVKLESGGDVEIKGAGGKLAISASGVELSSNASLKVQANAMLDVKTSAVLNIQGSLVKIN